MYPNRAPYFDVNNTEGVQIYVPDEIKQQQAQFHQLHQQKYHRNKLFYFMPIGALAPYLTLEKDPPFSKLRILGWMKDYGVVEDLNGQHFVRLYERHIEEQERPKINQFYEIFGVIEHKNEFSVYFFTDLEDENEARMIERDLLTKQKKYYNMY